MRNFEKDWELVNQVDKSLRIHIYNYQNGACSGTSFELDVSRDEPSEADIQFIEQGKEMLLYYMNRVRELENMEVQRQKQRPPMAQVEQWMNEDYKKFTEEFKMRWSDAFKKVIKKYEEEYKNFGIITMGKVSKNDIIYFRPYGLPKKKRSWRY